jgi:hypothetical protein
MTISLELLLVVQELVLVVQELVLAPEQVPQEPLVLQPFCIPSKKQKQLLALLKE